MYHASADNAQLHSLKTSTPQQRGTNANDAQDEASKHSLASHYTISRDETTSGSSMKDKLHALRAAGSSTGGGGQERRPEVVREVVTVEATTAAAEMARMQDYQQQLMLLEAQNKERLRLARAESSESSEVVIPRQREAWEQIFQHERDRSVYLANRESGSYPIASFLTSNEESDEMTQENGSELRLQSVSSYDTQDADIHIENNTPERMPGQSENLILSLQQKIKALQIANERLLRQQREDKNGVNFEVFHCISNQDEEEIETYLEKPYWAVTSNGFQLKADSPILYPDAYIRYKSLAFVVYRYYSVDEGAETREALQQTTKVPDPVPTNEVIRLISEDMVRATKAFMKNHESSQKKYPCLFLDKEMPAPYFWWYYYRGLPNVLDNLSQPQAELIRSLTSWIDGNYSQIYSRIDGQLERGMVSRASMGFLIRPGDVLVHTAEDCVEAYLATCWLQKEQNTLATDESRSPSNNPNNKIIGSTESSVKESEHEWGVEAWSYEYNGEFTMLKTRLIIELHAGAAFTEEIPIVNLDVFPLRFASHELCEALELRGNTFWSCRHRRYVSYANGTKDRDSTPGQRYMIDYPTYQALHPGYTIISSQRRELKVEPTFIEQEVLSKPDVYLLPRTIRGFNLRRKKWEDLDVDLIREVSWNKHAFKHLVADPDTKELVQALVTNKVAAERGTDLMQNKGNGLIMLLHGGPGTGKTFTAESVAEIAEKPLYPVTCGDIGTKPEDVEKYLESVFHLGKIWGCVVLLDEAEVFLEQRSLNDLARNALVSVFLRALEYYDGILILTSNRVGTFDEAFKSRIQLALHYEPLTQPRRAQIWRNFFSRLKSLGEDNIDFDDVEGYIGELSEREMNGRQIRNVITTARQWAQFQGKTMTASHLKYAIKVTSKFDLYIKDVKEGFSDEQIARGDGVR
ncbi:hypothetical protein ACHAQJ_009950 [Trichoderma viride]